MKKVDEMPKDLVFILRQFAEDANLMSEISSPFIKIWAEEVHRVPAGGQQAETKDSLYRLWESQYRSS